ADLRGRYARFTVATSQFNGMGWVVEHLGVGAIVYPGFGIKDQARAAIQILSEDPPERRVFTHTGWRQIGQEWVYLHGGGAIGAKGVRQGIEVALPEALSRFQLPPPPYAEDLATAIHASLGMIEVADRRITVPIYCSIWTAILGGNDFSAHLSGPTSAGKSELTALAQQHFGPEMDARHLPGSWSSTGNALEAMAFAAKDALLAVDDFVPTGSRADVQRMHREADRLLRAQGNVSGRIRLRPDASVKPPRPPRGIILSTGEDIPRGQSLQARLLALELPREGDGSLDWDLLSQCQNDACSGLYSQALSGFVQWLVPQYEEVQRSLKEEVANLRDQAHQSGQHRRTPDIVARLGVGLRYFLEFAQDRGAMTSQMREDVWARCWSALGETAAFQATHQQVAEPATQFLELLGGVIASGRAHIASTKGKKPDSPEAWGWREITVGTGDYTRQEWGPQGHRVGWVEDTALYLNAAAAYAEVQRLAGDGGDALTVTLPTLKRRLHDKGLLASIEQRGGKIRLEVR
ncbi:MAG: DUF927 domain-containing protein, partial [Dehalococcoidia bacterium]